MTSSAKHPLARQRKRKVNPKPNALFMLWLTEWRNEAKEKGWKSESMFDKALQSLQKYPMPLSSGRECRILQNFGPKICAMLDERLCKHNIEQETQACAGVRAACGGINIAEDIKKKTGPFMRYIRESSEKEDDIPSEMCVLDICSSTDDEDNQMHLKEELPSRSQVDSGQLTSALSPNMPCCAAWNCSNKAKKGKSFHLFPQNEERRKKWIAALRCENFIPTQHSVICADPFQESCFDRIGQLPTFKGPMTKAELCVTAQPLADKSFTVPEPTGRYTAWSSVSTIIKKDFVIKEGNPARYRLSEFGYQLAASLHKTEERHTAEPYANVCDMDGTTLGLHVNASIGKNNDSNHYWFVSGSTASHPVHEISDSDSEIDSRNCISSDPKCNAFPKRDSSPSVSCSSVTQPAPVTAGAVVDPSTVVQTINTTPSSGVELKSLFSGSPMYPGSFEIVLCVDNREFYGSQSNSKTLFPELIRNGVACELRCLNVGDLLWIAREKKSMDPVNRKQELVLTYIVERKRLDDLVSSVTTGRLKEQKFRLRHCGIREKILLIENFGTMKNLSISEERIHQTIANSEIIDGFTIKWTHDSKETAAYLILMTRHLEKLYKNKVLWPAMLGTAKQETADVGNHQYLMPFDYFNQTSAKHKILSVKELFAKQLVQLSGISAEKAKSITSKYATPCSLLQAYSSCHSEKARECLLSDVKCGQTLRNLGSSISGQVAKLYCCMKLL